MNLLSLILGVLYGEENQLSQHYRKINQQFPVIIGKEFWHRLTGFSNFYDGLVDELHQSILTIDTKDLINQGCTDLAEEIKNSPFFDF